MFLALPKKYNFKKQLHFTNYAPRRFIYSPSGKFVYFSQQHAIFALNIATKQEIHVTGVASEQGQRNGTLQNSRFNKIGNMSISSDGKVLFVIDDDNGLLRRVDLFNNIVSTILEFPISYYTNIMMPDGNHILISDRYRTIIVNIITNQIITRIQNECGQVLSLCPDGMNMITHVHGSIYITKSNNLDKFASTVIKIKSDKINIGLLSCIYSPDGSIALISGHCSKKIRVIDFEYKDCLYYTGDLFVSHLQMSPNSKVLLLCDQENCELIELHHNLTTMIMLKSFIFLQLIHFSFLPRNICLSVIQSL